jgi:hypothetical protein
MNSAQLAASKYIAGALLVVGAAATAYAFGDGTYIARI